MADSDSWKSPVENALQLKNGQQCTRLIERRAHFGSMCDAKRIISAPPEGATRSRTLGR
jgi:hypothetical protein